MDRSGGSIPFERFMERALYHPDFGYYAATESIPTGRRGDFFTNVSVGALFGEFIGWRLLQQWEAMGRPEQFTIAEQGAMDAQLAVDLLRWARSTQPDFFAAIDSLIVEPFAANRERQQSKLAEAGLNLKARWVADWSELGEKSISGAVFTNELIDSFPVRRIVRRGGQWHESFVTWGDGRFVFIDVPVEELFRIEIERRLIPEVEGYTAEINLHAADWMRSVAWRLQSGIVLTVDYGFPRATLYAPERPQGTLQCYRAHQCNDDPLQAVGQQDITTHIDFTTLMETGKLCGLHTAQFLDQHHFMMERIAQAEAAGRKYSPKEIRQLQTLIHPEMLGTRFQYLIQVV